MEHLCDHPTANVEVIVRHPLALELLNQDAVACQPHVVLDQAATLEYLRKVQWHHNSAAQPGHDGRVVLIEPLGFRLVKVGHRIAVMWPAGLTPICHEHDERLPQVS